jgi:ribokinase
VNKAVVVGAANRDWFFSLERLPAPGETVTAHHYVADGGKGANQAAQLALLGVSTTFVGCVGNDDSGTALLDGLQVAGVDTGFVRRTNGTETGTGCIWVAGADDKRIVVSPGANDSLTAEDVEAAAAAIEESELVLVQLEVPLGAVRRAVELASVSGSAVVVNAAPARRDVVELLPRTSVLIVNRSECAALSSRPVDTPQAVDEAARTLCSLGARTTMVTLGAEGARVVSRDATSVIAPVPTDAIDPTGAGDAFCGAVAAALVQGLRPVDAARVGVLAGSLSATRRGARAFREDAPRILEELSARADDRAR